MYALAFGRREALKGQGDITKSSVFVALDRLVTNDFIASLPAEYKNPLGMADQAGQIDTDLYLVHLLPHALSSSGLYSIAEVSNL